jgi:hypothetical protein
VTAASVEDVKLALSTAKDLLENLKDTEDADTPLISMDVNFLWVAIRKYLGMLVALITMSGKVPSEVSQKSNKGESESASRSSGSRMGFGIGKDSPSYFSQRTFLRNQDGGNVPKVSTSGAGAASNRSSNNDIAMQEERLTQLGNFPADFFTVESEMVVKSVDMSEFNKKLGKSGVQSVLGKLKMPQEKGMDPLEWSGAMAEYFYIAMPALSTLLLKKLAKLLPAVCVQRPSQAGSEEGLQIRFISFAANMEGAAVDAKDNVQSAAFKEQFVTWLLLITVPEDVAPEGWGHATKYAVKVYGDNLNKCVSFDEMYEFLKPLFPEREPIGYEAFRGGSR